MSTRYDSSIDVEAANNTHASLVRLVGTGRRVLELGASSGYMTRLLMERGNDVTPVEVDQAAFKTLQSVTAKARLGDLEEPMVLDGLGEFDVVLAGDVLEHLRDPEPTLAAAVALLAPEGRVVISVPNVTHVDLRLLLMEGRFEYHDTGLLDATHVHFFTLDTLVGLLRSTGLLPWTIERITSGPGETELGIGRDLVADPATAHLVRSAESLTYQFVVEAVVDTGAPDLRAESDRRLALARESEAERIAALGPAPDPAADLAAELARVSAELADLIDRSALTQRYLRQAEIDRDVARRELADARAGMSASDARAARADSRSVELSHELDLVHGSRSFRALAWYARQVERVAPAGSTRDRVYRDAVSRSAAAVRAIRRRRQAARPPVTVLDLTCAASTPLVSVVVPVHGKWDYTWRCLQSLAHTSPGVPFEVIVVDDASLDDTRALLRHRTSGVRTVVLDKNVGYVAACNAGIDAARGEFVVLLNNDTEVHPGWLAPMVETMSDPTIGLVGSRLVYPDGRLQEAGAIIFSDASGWNYGRFSDPEDEAYTYRRDVDYCSGASIMLRRSFLTEHGGLDETFAPAYFDDVDLAFSVRAHGLRVVYEPRSYVVHHEGVSHGVDESGGVKSYQAVNRLKFQKKWAAELVGHPLPDAALVPSAARRRQGRGIVVVVDHYVPRPDEDSGSVRMRSLLETLRGLGFGVIFLPENRHRHEPYVGHLQQLGIEVVYDHVNVEDRLRPLARDVVAVMVSRASVARSHLMHMRDILPDAPFIFDTVDLQFLRHERQDEVEGRSEPSATTRATRQYELAAVRSADVTLVVSPFEQRLLGALVPEADVRLLSNVHTSRPVDPVPASRTGLLFVGSFAHHPNNDGIRWFVDEVLPLVLRDHPDLTLSVVGRDPDPAIVTAAPPQVRFLGHVADLSPLYASTRATIAPLRYGAGVKGKIGESLTFGVPVVMTTVGAEGMGIRNEENALVADSAVEFAAQVGRVLEEDDLWMRLSAAGIAHVEATFGMARFTAQVVDMLRAGAAHAPPADRERIRGMLENLA